MSDVIEHGSVTFSDISQFGDNTDRVNDIMAVPTIGQTSIVRYKVPSNYTANVGCVAVTCDYEKLLLSGAYTTAQNGAILQVRFGATVKLETKMNWTGLSGYIGGADDYNSENEVMISGYDTTVDASTAIDVYVTGGTNVRRMIYVELYGTLSDGTEIRETAKQAVDGTSATSVSVYTVPGGYTLSLRQLVITTRHIDLYAGRGYLVYNGLPVMFFDVMQTEIGGVNGLVFPFYAMPLQQSNSIGVRLDSFECGNEIVSASVYSSETSIGGGTGGVSRSRVVNQ